MGNSGLILQGILFLVSFSLVQGGGELDLNFVIQGEKLKGMTYIIGPVLGRGAEAVTYAAMAYRNGKLVMPVAIKVLREGKDGTTEKNALRVFKDYKGIVRIYDCAGWDNNYPWGQALVLEQLKCTIHVLAKQLGIISFSKARQIIGELLRTLEYMHINGYAHSDLNCDNIMFRENEGTENTVIIDLGAIQAFATTSEEIEKIWKDSLASSELIYKDLMAIGRVLTPYLFRTGAPDDDIDKCIETCTGFLGSNHDTAQLMIDYFNILKDSQKSVDFVYKKLLETF